MEVFGENMSIHVQHNCDNVIHNRDVEQQVNTTTHTVEDNSYWRHGTQ